MASVARVAATGSNSVADALAGAPEYGSRAGAVEVTVERSSERGRNTGRVA
jgi:hypothetical protein